MVRVRVRLGRQLNPDLILRLKKRDLKKIGLKKIEKLFFLKYLICPKKCNRKKIATKKIANPKKCKLKKMQTQKNAA